MQGTHLFEYAVIRVMPRVEREEFINVGVILYCPSHRFLETLYLLDEKKLCNLAVDLDLAALEMRLQAFKQICAGRQGVIGEMPIASRFRWLTAARSTVVQTSPVHPGLCIDPTETLLKLFGQLVL